MSQATALSLRLPNNAVSDEQLLQEMIELLPAVGVQNLALAYAGDPTLPTTDGAFRVMWQACLEQEPLPRLVRVIDVIYSKDTFSQDTFQMRVTTLFLTAMSFTSVPILKPELDQLCSQSSQRTTPLALVAPIMEKAQLTADEDLITVFNEIAKQLKGEPKVAAFLTEIANLSPSEKASKISTFMQQNSELLSKITKLHVSNKKLSTLPSEIALLVNLQELLLVSNRLTQLPEALFKLVKLQVLYLSDNQLRQLPEAFFKLVNLQELNLLGNQLTQLPEALFKLVKLETLNLTGNQLTQLPEALFKLVKLETLNLTGNRLTQLPEALSKLENLRRLFLGNNQLTQLPEAFSKLENLRRLYLGNNQLTQLPEAFSKLVNLRELYLRDNPLAQQAKDALAPLIERGCQVFA